MKGLSRREFLGTGTLFTAGALTLAGARSALSQEWAGQSEGIYRTLRDPKIISELEMKHVPLIKAPERVKKGEKFEVAVRIGRTSHPMEMPHHIEWLRFFRNGRPLAEVNLSCEGVTAAAALTLALVETSQIEVRILCNLHGYWMAANTIEVS